MSDEEGLEGPEAEEVAPDEEGPEEDLQERLMRLVAEFDNYRKRTERDMAEFRKRAADGVLLSVLEVMDNLDRALETADTCDPEDLRQGIEAIRSQLAQMLDREGLGVIEAAGQPFDPYEMEAVLRMPSAEVPEGNVVREIQVGYKGRGYVLRPSKVIVSSGPPEEAEGGEAGEDGTTDDGC